MFGVDITTASDFSLRSNNTRSMRMSVVPNDPADFVRNSYDTQTINNIMLSLGHSYIDILKMDHFADSSQSHDVLYFMIKDDLLSRAGQLHIALHIGMYWLIYSSHTCDLRHSGVRLEQKKSPVSNVRILCQI